MATIEQQEQQFQPPIIIGAAGDIGRSALQQLVLERGIVPAGIVLRDERLADAVARTQTARQIADNFHTAGVRPVFNEVHLRKDELLVDGACIPVFTPQSQHEIIQAGYPVIEATGQHKVVEAFEPLLENGASFVLVTGPMKDATETIIAGVNGTPERYMKARSERICSTSSCTTTAGSSFLGPVLRTPAERINSGVDLAPLQPSAVFLNILHARTKSNSKAELRDTIMMSPSGAATEIPKVLDINPRKTAIELECSRANISCGSLAIMGLLMSPEEHDSDSSDIKSQIIAALQEGSSSYELDDAIDSTRSVIGRRSSVILNLSQIRSRKLPGNQGTLVTGILGYYDNVGGYTRSALDSYAALDAVQTSSHLTRDLV